MAVTRIPQATLCQWVAQASLGTLRWECRYRVTDTGGTSTHYEMVGTWLNCIPVFRVQECSVGQDLLKCLVKDVSKKESIPADGCFPLTALENVKGNK